VGKRIYIYRSGATDNCALTGTKNDPRLPSALLRTIGGFGCGLVLSRRKAAHVVLTSELLCMASERRATTFSRGPERSYASALP